MNATEIIRYSEIIAGFSADELKRLPLALEVYGTLPELIDAMVSRQALYESNLDTGIALDLLKELESSMENEADARQFPSLLGKLWPNHHIGHIRRLRERSEAIYSDLVREYSFLSARFELDGLIRSAHRNALLEALAKNFGEGIRAEHRGSFEFIEKSNSLVMELIIEAFRNIDSRYEFESRALSLTH